ncbi:MAG: chaperone modulator CbpM [Acidiferrobacteraceae bacterium]
MSNETVLHTREVLECAGLELDSLVAFVHEEIVQPYGGSPEDWSFTVAMVMRVRQARRLQRDLELETHALALTLQLMDEVQSLRRQVRHLALLSPDIADV